jgi:hypothetical protein
LSSESRGKYLGVVGTGGDSGKCGDTVTSGGENSEASVIAGAIERDLNARDAIAGGALDNNSKVGGKKCAAAQETEKEDTNAGQLSSSRERG